MALLHSDALCPYCLRELRSKDLTMVCQICGTPVTPSKAELLLKKTPKCRQAGCHGFANGRQCGYCGSKLPADILDYEKYLRFSILGIAAPEKQTF